jgi:hypothetical protein
MIARIRGTTMVPLNSAKIDHRLPRVVARTGVITSLVLTAALAGFAGTVDLKLAFAIAAILAGVHYFVLRIDPTVAVAFSVAAVALSSTYIERTSPTGISQIARVVALLLVVKLLLQRRQEVAGDRVWIGAKQCSNFVVLLMPGLVVYLFTATVLHGHTGTFSGYLAGCILIILYARIVSSCADARSIATAALVVLMLIVVVSLLFGLLSPANGLLGGRLRGVVSNPNLLGFYCVLAVALLSAAKRFGWPHAAGLATAFVAIAWSASRASGVCACLIVIADLLRRRGASRVVWCCVLLAAVVTLVRFPSLILDQDLVVLRTNNSRDGSYQYAASVFRDGHMFGIGLGSEETQVASTPLRALVHAGIPGLVGVGAMYAAVVYVSAKVGRKTTAFALVMVVHSLFEGWMLSPVGPMMMAFVVTWCAIAKNDLSVAAGGRPGERRSLALWR